MSNFIFEEANERHKFAKKLLEAIKKSDFQIISTPKISKTKLIKFLRSTIQDLKITMNIHKDCDIELVDQFTDMNPNKPVDLKTSEGDTIRILTKEQQENLKDEIEEIEKYYPGENALTEQEKMCKKSFESLHDYQLFISRVREGISEIIINGDGSITLFMTK